jgi:hypothetical protein
VRAADSMARVRNWRTGKLVCSPLRHTDEVFDARFAGHADWILTTGRDERLMAWEHETGGTLASPLTLGHSAPYQLEVTPDGEHAIVAGKVDGVQVFDLGELLQARLRQIDSRSLCTFAEVVSGQALHEGKSADNLSSEQWLERWHDLRHRVPELFESGDRSDPENANLERALRDLSREGRLDEVEALLFREIPSGGWRARKLIEKWFMIAIAGKAQSCAAIVARLPLDVVPHDRGFQETLREAIEGLSTNRALRINCGGTEYHGADGRVWCGDRFFRRGHLHQTMNTHPTTDIDAFRGEIAGTDDDYLYRTERWFSRETFSGESSYRIPLLPGRYGVVLHFAEIYWHEPGQRRFDVEIESRLVSTGLDLIEDGFATAIRKRFDLDVDDGFLDLRLVPVTNFPKISAIEILSLDPLRLLTS